jgi:hypothetical protein
MGSEAVIGTDVFLSGPETRSFFGQETETRVGTGIVRGKNNIIQIYSSTHLSLRTMGHRAVVRAQSLMTHRQHCHYLPARPHQELPLGQERVQAIPLSIHGTQFCQSAHEPHRNFVTFSASRTSSPSAFDGTTAATCVITSIQFHFNFLATL